MYEQHFGLNQRPFSLIPDPSFLYLGRKHAMALTMLEYGVSNDAPIIVITGEIGAGKTTLIRHLLTVLDEKTSVGLISNTHKAFGELIQWVAMAFGLPIEGKEKVALYSAFVDFLIKEYSHGRKTVLIVDEAQNMSPDTLEELRVISNINADRHVVLQIVLVGQPELRDTLLGKGLEQFVQRVSVDYHLGRLDRQETQEYVAHRLIKAGGRKELISEDAVSLIFEVSLGTPRLINGLCDAAFVYAFADGQKLVTRSIVQSYIDDRKNNGLLGAGKLDYEASN